MFIYIIFFKGNLSNSHANIRSMIIKDLTSKNKNRL